MSVIILLSCRCINQISSNQFLISSFSWGWAYPRNHYYLCYARLLALFSSIFVILALCQSLIIIFGCENSFHPSGAIQESFQFDYPESINSSLFILRFQLSFSNLTGASFKWSLISSWSLRSHGSKFSHVSSFIFQFLPSDSSLYFVHFKFLWWFVQEFFSFVIIQIHSFFHPTGGSSKTFSSCAISIFILSTRISSVQNLLLVINLNWWRIHIT